MRIKHLGLLFCFCALVSSAAVPAQKRRGRASKPAPVIQVKQVDLEEFKQLLSLGQTAETKRTKPLLVNFWATWCDPCREEFPDLVKIDKDYRSRGLDFIAISLDDPPDIKTTVPAFLNEMQAKMPTYLLNVSDPEPAIQSVDRSWSGALPATFLYDAKGAVVFKQFGRVQTEELRAAIEKLVGAQ
ncbi:MAG TPA: TlpA disulfide reductase family protein [Pyrinomonadaceae bacterium]|nr:TlpA disulfide reductase family protein [Pyrinomonadaceae bacterium]